MAAFANTVYATSVLPNTWTTATYTTAYVTNAMNVRANEPLYAAYAPSVPVGQPLRTPPQEGTWIAEKAKGAKPRKIIEVVCGSHVVCEGKRHSIIAWKNLGRYIEVDSPWDYQDPLKSP